VMGLTPITLFVACALVARNFAVADAFSERQADNQRRATAGLPPRTRRRRRRTHNDLIAATANAPPKSNRTACHQAISPRRAHRQPRHPPTDATSATENYQSHRHSRMTATRNRNRPPRKT
jgi:hypothetical protein